MGFSPRSVLPLQAFASAYGMAKGLRLVRTMGRKSLMALLLICLLGLPACASSESVSGGIDTIVNSAQGEVLQVKREGHLKTVTIRIDSSDEGSFQTGETPTFDFSDSTISWMEPNDSLEGIYRGDSVEISYFLRPDENGNYPGYEIIPLTEQSSASGSQ